MQILLLGCTGQVGWELQRSLSLLGNVTALSRCSENGRCGDLNQPEALVTTVRQLAPDVIVNAAAYTAVDQAESEPELAEAINTNAPAVLAAEARALDAWLIHYSTDYVFDGSGKRPWNEDDPAAPINVYGRTKRDGEQAIQQSGCRHLIFRTSWVYAARGGNFIRTMLRLASEREVLRVIDDQYGAPTGAELIADTTAAVLMQCVNDDKMSGLYHLAADGETTWHAFALRVITTARDAGWPIRISDDAVEPVTSDAFPTSARRPHNSRLDTSRLQTTFGLHMPDWRAGVDRALDEILICDSPGRSS